MIHRYPQIEFDALQMYFGEPYVIDCESARGKITVYQPTLGDVVRKGEIRFFQTLKVFTDNTTVYRLPLWKAGIDWNVFTDFQLFQTLYKEGDDDIVAALFGDVRIKDFVPVTHTYPDGTENVTLYNQTLDIEINEEVYQHIHQYLQQVFNYIPDEKITQDPFLKDWYIKKDEQKALDMKAKEEMGTLDKFSMQSTISAVVNHPGSKYKLKELLDIGVCEFYDSVQRLSIYESTTALMKGMYSGFVDGKKIKPEDYNFMKPINKNK